MCQVTVCELRAWTQETLCAPTLSFGTLPVIMGIGLDSQMEGEVLCGLQWSHLSFLGKASDVKELSQDQSNLAQINRTI